MTPDMKWTLFLLTLLVLPSLTLGTIRKIKARLQNRIGAPVYQPLLDLLRLLQKDETVSGTTSWIFRSTSALNLALALSVAFYIPWLSYKPAPDGADLFLVVYIFALSRFFSVLSSLDTGSAFTGFGASREVTLALLLEPAVVLSLASLGVAAHSSDLSVIFFFGTAPGVHPWLWLLAGTGLFLSSLVELSRMPTDDPTTHLELTMVHEAMSLENSGPNLALKEYAYSLKLVVLLGLCAQCLLHAFAFAPPPGETLMALVSIGLVLLMAAVVAIIESTAVKLRWVKVPEFIAYSVAMALLCMLISVGRS